MVLFHFLKWMVLKPVWNGLISSLTGTTQDEYTYPNRTYILQVYNEKKNQWLRKLRSSKLGQRRERQTHTYIFVEDDKHWLSYFDYIQSFLCLSCSYSTNAPYYLKSKWLIVCSIQRTFASVRIDSQLPEAIFEYFCIFQLQNQCYNEPTNPNFCKIWDLTIYYFF